VFDVKHFSLPRFIAGVDSDTHPYASVAGSEDRRWIWLQRYRTAPLWKSLSFVQWGVQWGLFYN
jgi:hypothetical protein